MERLRISNPHGAHMVVRKACAAEPPGSGVDRVKNSQGQIISAPSKVLHHVHAAMSAQIAPAAVQAPLQGTQLDTPPLPAASRGFSLTDEAVSKASGMLNNHKAAGPSGVKGEHIKYAPQVFQRALAESLRAIATVGRVPDHMHDGIGHLLPKRGGDPLRVDQRRLIVAGCPFAKVLQLALLEYLAPIADGYLGQEQAGFRSDSNCVEQIFALNEGLNQAARSGLTGPARPVRAAAAARAATPVVAFLDFSNVLTASRAQPYGTPWKP